MPDISTLGDADSVARVVVEGEVVDPPHGSQLYEAICAAIKQRAKVVHVDLAAVPFLGSVGIDALIKASNEAASLDCEVIVIAASAFVRELLQAADLTDLLADQG